MVRLHFPLHSAVWVFFWLFSASNMKFSFSWLLSLSFFSRIRCFTLEFVAFLPPERKREDVSVTVNNYANLKVFIRINLASSFCRLCRVLVGAGRRSVMKCKIIDLTVALSNSNESFLWWQLMYRAFTLFKSAYWQIICKVPGVCVSLADKLSSNVQQVSTVVNFLP